MIIVTVWEIYWFLMDFKKYEETTINSSSKKVVNAEQ